MNLKHILLFCWFLLVSFCPVFAADANPSLPVDVASSDKIQNPREQYLSFFEEVYEVMNENYYFDVKRTDFERFIKTFDEEIYSNLLSEGKSNDYVRWRSAAYLVDFIKQPDDIFSKFWPP